MTKGQQNGPMQRRPRQPLPRQRRKLSAHPAFASLLGIWGAALGGLCVLVLPARLIAQLGQGTGVMLLGPQAQALLAAGAATLLGGSLFLTAHAAFRKTRLSTDAPSLVSLASRHVRAIDPKRDLGSASLDEPLGAMPFATEQPSIITPADTFAADAPKPAAPLAEHAVQAPSLPAADPWADQPVPLELDLAQFAELPGRNAVWVDTAAIPDPVAAAANVPVTLVAVPDTPPVTPAPAPLVHPSAAALAHLRAQPPQDLSLVQMVERFAGALHEHRTGTAGKTVSGRDLAAREAALVEALKALAALSGFEATPKQDEPLRDALTHLQGLRGAA